MATTGVLEDDGWTTLSITIAGRSVGLALKMPNSKEPINDG